MIKEIQCIVVRSTGNAMRRVGDWLRHDEPQPYAERTRRALKVRSVMHSLHQLPDAIAHIFLPLPGAPC